MFLNRHTFRLAVNRNANYPPQPPVLCGTFRLAVNGNANYPPQPPVLCGLRCRLLPASSRDEDELDESKIVLLFFRDCGAAHFGSGFLTFGLKFRSSHEETHCQCCCCNFIAM